MEIDWYNDSWGSKGSNFIPMPLKGTQGNLQNELTYSKISSSFFEHPALSMFNDPRNGSLAEALIKKWILMDESNVRNDPTVTVLARLTNGQPIMVEKIWKEARSSFRELLLTQIGQICPQDQATFHLHNKSQPIFLKKYYPPELSTQDCLSPIT